MHKKTIPSSRAKPPPVSARTSSAAAASPGSDNPAWQDWRWQLRHRLRTWPHLRRRFPGLQPIPGFHETAARFPMAITPYYASLIERADFSDPIFLQCVPRGHERENPPYLSADPCSEQEDAPVSGLLHHYPDRVLLLLASQCGVYCRHCTRKWMTGQARAPLATDRIPGVTAYLRNHPEVRDVILSGGDPLTLATEDLEPWLAAIRHVDSVDVIRIGTRIPVVLPMRITDELTAMLRTYHPVYVNTHFNHPRELTAEARAACEKLADAGIPLGNQAVLLRGVNDTANLQESLCRGLVRMRVRPYYLFQCDLAHGTEHFRTTIAHGQAIMELLQTRLGGLALPRYVLDTPNRLGKIPLNPDYIVARESTRTILRNAEGRRVEYPEPPA